MREPRAGNIRIYVYIYVYSRREKLRVGVEHASTAVGIPTEKAGSTSRKEVCGGGIIAAEAT